MPKRSNRFQQLIRIIEEQAAPSGAIVRESALIADRSGITREIDVYVEIPVGVRSVVLAIECRDHARRADVNWIDQVVGKYRDLVVDQLTIVASAGFTPNAILKARALGIRTLTLGQAEVREWLDLSKVPVSVRVDKIGFLTDQITLTVNTNSNAGRLPTGWDYATFKAPGDSAWITLTDLKLRLLGISDVQKAAGEENGVKPDIPVLVGVAFEGWLLKDGDGIEYPLKSAELRIVRREANITLPMTQATYGDAHISYTTGSLSGVGFTASSVITKATANSPTFRIHLEPEA